MEKFSAARKGAIRPRGTANPALAMALIGAGLLLLGIAAMAMLPMLLPVDGSPAGVEKSYFSAVPVMVDYPAPVLKLADLDGNSVGLDDLSGSVVLVNHWATWCPPCKAEMPVLQSFYDDYRGHNFTLVAIDAGESQEQVEAYAAGVGLSFPVWVDPTQRPWMPSEQPTCPARLLSVRKAGW